MPQLHPLSHQPPANFLPRSSLNNSYGETRPYNRNRTQIKTADYLGIFIISTTTVCQGPRPNLEQRSVTALGGWVSTERGPLCVYQWKGGQTDSSLLCYQVSLFSQWIQIKFSVFIGSAQRATTILTADDWINNKTILWVLIYFVFKTMHGFSFLSGLSTLSNLETVSFIQSFGFTRIQFY